MNGFLKNVLHRMNSNTKIIKIFSIKSKRKQKIYTTLTNYLNVLEVLKNMECYERYNSKIKNKTVKSSSKLTINKVNVYHKREIAGVSMISLQILFTNCPVKYQKHLKHLKHI